MYVRFLMSTNLITIRDKESVLDAIHIMRTNKVRRLPVVNKKGDLVGIIADIDVVEYAPSKATSLDRFELNYLIAKTPVSQIMTAHPFTISPEDPIEEAARIMEAHNIGGLPVVDGDKLVGIITEIDVFRAFMQILGVKRVGARLCVHIPNDTGELRKLIGLLSDEQVSKIVSIASYEDAEDSRARSVILRLETQAEDAVRALLANAGYQLCQG